MDLARNNLVLLRRLFHACFITCGQACTGACCHCSIVRGICCGTIGLACKRNARRQPHLLVIPQSQHATQLTHSYVSRLHAPRLSLVRIFLRRHDPWPIVGAFCAVPHSAARYFPRSIGSCTWIACSTYTRNHDNHLAALAQSNGVHPTIRPRCVVLRRHVGNRFVLACLHFMGR